MLNEGNDMNPNLLENKALRKDAVWAYYKVIKKIAEFSNQNAYLGRISGKGRKN